MTEYLTVAQAAEHLGVSARTVRRYVQAGKLRGRKIVRADGLQEWQVEAESARTVAAAGRERTRPQKTSLVPADTTAAEVRALRDQVDKLTAAVAAMLSAQQEAQLALPAAREELTQARIDAARAAATAEETAAKATALQQQNELLTERLAAAERDLERERRRTWWQRLTGRGKR